MRLAESCIRFSLYLTLSSLQGPVTTTSCCRGVFLPDVAFSLFAKQVLFWSRQITEPSSWLQAFPTYFLGNYN